MRAITMFITLIFLTPIFAIAETVEETVRRLDLAEADAVLRADFDTVEKLWAEDMTKSLNPESAEYERAQSPTHHLCAILNRFKSTVTRQLLWGTK